MKSSILSILAAIVLTTLGLTACKKANLTKDQWIIVKATDLQDGSDITADYTGEIWEFDKNENYLKNGVLKGVWKFSDGKEDLTIYKVNGNVDNYKILKLKKKEMWLEELGKEELHLEKY